MTNNCDVAANGNAGCGVQATTPNSYGKSFNGAGGGFYAMERTSTFIKVWFWSRKDKRVPLSVKYGSPVINPDLWGACQSKSPLTLMLTRSRSPRGVVQQQQL